MSHSIIQSQEMERTRIARDMHDSFIGDLLRIQFKLAMNGNIQDHELKELISKSRSIIHDLSPPMIDESSIEEILRQELRKYSEKFTTSLSLNVERIQSEPTPDQKIHIFRIFQELLQNSFKHSDAKIIEICMHERKSYHYYTYQDVSKNDIPNSFKNRKTGIHI